MVQLNRLLRHLLTPVVMFLVERGLLPEYMQNDVVEVGVIACAFAITCAMSWWRDSRRSVK